MLILENKQEIFKHGEYGIDWSGPVPSEPKLTNVIKLSYNYRGYSDLGFEYEIDVDIWKNVAYSTNLDSNMWECQKDIVKVYTDPTRIYLSQAEVEEMYKDPKAFYLNYIQGTNTCYIQTVATGGAGSDN